MSTPPNRSHYRPSAQQPAEDPAAANRTEGVRKRTQPTRHRAAEQTDETAGIVRWYHHVTGLLLGAVVAVLVRGSQFPGDLGSLWIAGLLVRDGDLENLYAIDDTDFALISGDAWHNAYEQSDVSAYPHPFVHTPFVADVMAWITRVLSFDSAVFWMTVLSGWALVVFIVAAWRFWFEDEIPPGYLALGMLLGWLTTAFQAALYLGQTSPFIFAGVAYGLAAARTYPVRAGLVLGAVAVVKLTPVVLVVACLLFPRARKAGLVAMLFGICAVVISIISLGFSTFVTWVETLQELNAAALVAPNNGAINSLLNMEASEFPDVFVNILHDPPLWTSLTARIVALSLLAVVVATAWRSSEPWKIASVGIFTTLMATSSILWDHYVLIAALPLLGVLARGHGWVLYLVPACAVFAFPPLAALDSDRWFMPAALTTMVSSVLVLCIAEWRRPKIQRRLRRRPGNASLVQ